VARFQAYPLPMVADGVPPFGPGLAPAAGALGRARDRALTPLLLRPLDRSVLPRVNAIRERAGAPPLSSIIDAFAGHLPLLHLSAEPFEYPRTWPANVHAIGPGLWDPPRNGDDGGLLDWIDSSGRELVLVSVSSEFQDDGRIVDCALDGLAGTDYVVVATTAANDPGGRRVPANARVVRFASHGPLLQRASAVVCHAGMGITQKALAHGVPVCAIPVGRDQPEVARRVAVAEAGVRLSPRRLSPTRLRAAVAATVARKPGAERIAAAFAAAGGPERGADVLEALLPADAAAAR
jgi:MGT family glycosyltransferase